MAKIESIWAREIFDSRGNPTVEVDLIAGDNMLRAAVPSGASTGVYEALELRDDDKGRLLGKGVLKAVQNVNNIIAPKLVGMDVTQQAAIDKMMVEVLDGSQNQWGWAKSKLGANAILAVSMAVCRAGAMSKQMCLYQHIAQLAGLPSDNFTMPVPSFNVINGGSHAGNRLACQEFMILPVGAKSFKEAMQIGAEVYHTLKGVIKKKYGQDACNVGDEGGFAPSVQDNNEALDVLMEAIKKSGHESKVKIGTDVAASEFYVPATGKYDLDFKNPNSPDSMKKTAAEMIAYYKDWLNKYPFVSIEDPFDQDDWEAYTSLQKEVGGQVQIVGDDLLVTNPKRIQAAIEKKACNALLLKVNQIGSVTESITAAVMSFRQGWGVMVSHRSGETEDSFIADLVVGLGSGQIKTGAPCRSERLAKYNQLLRIEEELGPSCTYAGEGFRAAGTKNLPPQTQVAVVGHGPVGNRFIETLVAQGAGNFKVTVFCEEQFAAYNRVKLTTFMEHRDPTRLALSSEDKCNSTGVDLCFAKVDKIDRGSKTVSFIRNKDGSSGTLKYDKLVISTGSFPFVPPTPGLTTDTQGIFVYRTIDDMNKIIAHAGRSNVTKAAVIGGGLLGLEAAKALFDLKLETHVLEFAPGLMPPQLDKGGAALLKDKLASLGLKVHVDTKCSEVLSGPDGVCGLKISESGVESVLDVGLVIVSAGVRPRQELAQACGLQLGDRGGVKVNEKMQSTNDENVFAVGEIASLNGGMVYGLSAPGYMQADVAAEFLCNPSSTSKFTGADLSTKLKLLGVNVASFGGDSSFWFGRQYISEDSSQVMSLTATGQKGDPTYKKLVFTPDGKKLLGGILVGDVDEFAKLTAMSKWKDLGGLSAQQLLEGATPKVDDGGDGTNLGDDDLVCNCHSVTKKTIRNAIESGAHTFADIKARTKAGTGCGTCISTGPQPKLLAHTLMKCGIKKGLCTALPFDLADIEDLAKTRSLKALDDIIKVLGPNNSPSGADVDVCKKALEPKLELWFNGKKKGDGMNQIEQLKALKKDLFEFVDKMNCNPIFVRLAWHDSGTYDKNRTSFPDMGGANASIIFDPEIKHGANNGLDKAVKFLTPFKEDYPLVSWADVIQMASAIAVEHAKGPKIPMKYGRKDASGPEACPAHKSRGTAGNAGLPDAEAPYCCGSPDAATHLRVIFNRMGFNDQEIVALSGAHTIGRAFAERSGTVKEGYGEAKACPYTKSVGLCPVRHDGKAGVGMPGGKSWTKKWLTFDNEYFKVYKEKDPNLVWFSTDRSLHEDASFKPTFQKYADDQDAFFKDYAAVHKKLSELGSVFEPAEGIIID